MASRISRIAKLIELAEIEQDKAAKTLAAVQEQLVRENAQLESLQAYSAEYGQESLKLQQGFSVMQLQSRHAFGGKLTQAIATQEQVVAQLSEAVDKARDAWVEKRQEVKSLESLKEKLVDAETKRQNKHEQRMLDDLAAQRFNATK